MSVSRDSNSHYSSLKKEQKLSRKQLIVNTAKNLFATKEFKTVSVRQIAKAAGIGIGTIYHYYKNMDDLFLDVFLIHATELDNLIDLEESGVTDILETLCEKYITYMNDNLAFFQMMGYFMLGGTMTSLGTERLNNMMRSLIIKIEAALKKSGCKDADRKKAHCLFCALNGIMISYARYPGRSPAEIRAHTLALARETARIFGTN